MKEYPDFESSDPIFCAEGLEPSGVASGSPETRTGFCSCHVIPVLYVISVYLLPVFLFLSSESEDTLIAYLPGIPFLLGIANVINAVRFCKPGNRIMLLDAAVLVKYALIPFFLIGGLLEVVSILFSLIPVPFAIFLFGSFAILGAVGGWLLLVLGGGPYVIAYLRLTTKEGVFRKGFAVFQGFLQFFFTVDVIHVMVLALREHRWVKLTFFVIGLLVFLALLAIVLLILGAAGVILTQS